MALAGYTAVVKINGTSTAMTGEAMTVTTGTTFQINNTAKRVWVPGATFVVYDGVTPVVPTSFDYLFGKVTLPSAPGGAVTIDGNYYPMKEVACAHTWDATLAKDLLDSTCFGTVAYRQRTAALFSASGTVGLHDTSYTELDGAQTGTIVFTGAGLDDMTKSGTFTGNQTRQFRVEIDGTGTPDTFKWSKNGGTTFEATTVPITGAAQLLTEGISVTFGATTGHTLTNRWDFTVSATNVFDRWLNATPTLLELALGSSGQYIRAWVQLEQITPSTSVDGLVEATFAWQSAAQAVGAEFSIGS